VPPADLPPPERVPLLPKAVHQGSPRADNSPSGVAWLSEQAPRLLGGRLAPAEGAHLARGVSGEDGRALQIL